MSSIITNNNYEISRICRICVLYTGGTIGMSPNADDGALAPRENYLTRFLRANAHFHERAEERLAQLLGNNNEDWLILPYDGQRIIVYKIIEYPQLLDSSNMSFPEWRQISDDIQRYYHLYDAFIVLHGTDTLVYTSSALSFMLENLAKMVIVTGSQIPIYEDGTDAVANFKNALIIAGNFVIPEVCVFFDQKLFRGNRTVKISSVRNDAFASPNFEQINIQRAMPRQVEGDLTVQSILDNNVAQLPIYPGMKSCMLEAALQSPTRGLVLMTFGAGNFPSNRPELLELLEEAAARGVIIVNCTQCMHGGVADLYEVGRQLYDYGVIPGYDMTPEAAYVKLAYVLAKEEWNLQKKKEMMKRNLRGELTNGSQN